MCVCASRGKSTLPDTLSQSQCYASSKNSSSLATSEPPTHPSQHTAWLQSIFVLRGDNSNLQLQFPTDFLNVAFSLSFGKIVEVLLCFVMKLNTVIIQTNSSKRRIVEEGRKAFLTSQAGSVECNTHGDKKSLSNRF